MAQSTKKLTVKRVFGSLVNNATAIDGAKFSPWWVGLLLFIFGLLLPIVPLFVSAAKTTGTSFMTSEYGLGLDKTFGEAINNLPGALTFNNTEKTISYDLGANANYSSVDASLIGGYVATSGNCKDQYELRIYYSTAITEEDINQFITSKESISYKKGTIVAAGIDETDNTYIPSSIFFFKNAFYMDSFASNTTTAKSRMSFLSDLNCFDYSNGDLKKYFVGDSFDQANKDNRVAAVNNLKAFINDTYKTTKTKSMWLGSLVYFGVYAGVNVFMVLMIFLMSRGKNNPFNYLTFWTCIKIQWWVCFCPGLLAMILGFIFPSNAVMMYVMLVAMRTMWLTMKELRPQY